MCAIDGLLFARPDDHKAKRFGKSQSDHKTKLAAVYLLPILITNISRIDPRYRNDPAFVSVLEISLKQLQADGNAVTQWTENDDFMGLDMWKQRGFYVSMKDNSLMPPRESVKRECAEAVQSFSWRVVTTFDFVLGNGNLDRYIEQAISIRKKMGEHDHESFELLGKKIADLLFVDEADSESVKPTMN